MPDEKPLHVLLIEDNPGDARLIQAYLKDDTRLPFQIEVADRLSAGFEYLSENPVDAVLLDLTLPDSSGLETVRRALEAFPKQTYIVLTGLDDDAAGLAAVAAGAQDYLVKSEVSGSLLARAIRHAIERKQRSQRLELLNEIIRQSITRHSLDSLLQALADSAAQIVGGDGSFITLWDAEAERAIPAAAYGDLRDRYRAIETEPGEPTLTGAAIRQSAPLIIEDVSQSPAISQRLVEMFPAHAMLVLPLRADERWLGALLIAFDHAHHFTEDEIHWAAQAGDLLALAIAKAQAHDELELRVEARTIELRRTKEQVETILNNSPDPILLLGLDGRVRQVNPAFTDLFGYLPTEILGRSPLFLMDEEAGALVRETWRQMIQQGATHRLEVIAHRKDEKRVNVEFALAPIYEEGALMGAVCILRDITSFKEIERMKDAFVSTSAHELRTPLTSIRGFSEILLTRKLDEERTRKYLTYINEQSTHLTYIIEDLLDLSRLKSGRGLELNREPVNIGQLVEEIVAPFEETAPQHTFVLDCLEATPSVSVDRFRLAQVLRNLVSNAVKYSPEGGVITISSELHDDEHVEIRVRDEGIGISPESQLHLFEQFYRADMSNAAIEGTGLGLSICKLIVEEHGGQIWADSEPGVGSTFAFTLPLIEDGTNLRDNLT